MSEWQIDYYPSEGSNHSPLDYINGLDDVNDKVNIYKRLGIMSEKPLNEWPPKWTHRIVGKIYQMTAGNHRVMYCLDGGCILVLHACRKRGRKTNKNDIKRAQLNYDAYFSRRGVVGS